MLRLRRACLLGLVLGFGAVPLLGQDKPDTAHDEKVLKDAGVGTSGPALLDFFRKRTLSDEDDTKLTNAVRGLGSPSFPVYGYDLKLLREADASEAGADEKAVVVVEPPLPPGCMSTLWGDDERFVKTYFGDFKGQQVYSTFDWGIRDKDGYYFILGRTDDVINVAGHRLGTREIEEAVNMHPNIAECAVVGVADSLKGQMPLAFAVLKDPAKSTSAEEIMQTVDKQLGAIARPKAVHFVTLLPKTRSGKTLRRSIQALAEGRDPGDLTTIEDPGALQQVKDSLAAKR